jgi:hypothetical protein
MPRGLAATANHNDHDRIQGNRQRDSISEMAKVPKPAKDRGALRGQNQTRRGPRGIESPHPTIQTSKVGNLTT